MPTEEQNKIDACPDRSLAVAQQLQRGLLPDIIPQAHPLHIGALTISADKVGGDFYDFIPHEQGTFDFVLGDVTGHGLTAALVVALAQATFREGVASDVDLSQLLDRADYRLHKRLHRRLFVAANYGRVLPSRGQVHIFSAGQQALQFDRRTGRCREIKAAGSAYPLGIAGRGGYVPLCLTLAQGDMVICFSDGLPEALNPGEEMFGYDRLQRTIEQASAAAPEELINYVFQAVFAFADGCAQADDLTMLVVKADAEYRPQEAARTTPPLAGERRPVALLGLQTLDGEEPCALPAAIWQQVQGEVDRHGGVIDRLSPDTLIACFGLPELHEDDPDRVLLAARAIERILQQCGLVVRCGLHLGTVIAHADGSLDYHLMGKPLVETLRLLDEAPPGRSHLSDATFRHLEGRLRLAASEEVRHGRRIYALSSLAPMRRLSSHRGRSERDIYVGRRCELSRLHRVWRRAARRRGAPTVASIVGEAGIGKSRLAEEFLQRRKAVNVLRGQAHAYPPEAGGLFASIVRHWLKMEEEEPERLVDHLNEKLQPLNDPRLQEAAPFLCALLGFRKDLPPHIDSRAYQAGLIRAIRRLVDRLARQQGADPLVLVLEDLHWMDSVSAAILTWVNPKTPAPTAEFPPDDSSASSPSRSGADARPARSYFLHF